MDEFTGTLLVITFGLAASTLVLKRILKYIPVVLRKPVKFVIKHHKKIGLVAILFLLGHFLFTYWSGEDEVTSGLVAGGLMIAQITTGILLRKQRGKTRKILLWIHRIVTFTLLAAILIHVD